MKRIAVVGAGLAGLVAARDLARAARVTLYEAADHFGGNARTVDVRLRRLTHGVDIGFTAFHESASPQLVALLAELGVGTVPAAGSFSAQIPAAGVEWSTAGPSGLFAQRSNLLRPGFLNMLGEIARLARLVRSLTRSGSAGTDDRPLGEFLDAHRFARSFRDWFLLPRLGCLWSCPVEAMLRMPVPVMARACDEHGLLRLVRGAPWRSIRGGSRHLVEPLLEGIADARRATPVRRVRRSAVGGADVSTDRGTERFDAVVFACRGDQALALLAEPTAEEHEVLGAVHYQRNRAVLHTDAGVLPENPRAWAAWNYERGRQPAAEGQGICVHTLVDRLQPLPFGVPVILSLNPLHEPAAASVQGEFHSAHPLPDRRAVAAQARLPALQGRGGAWFCGAWTGRGSPEDAVASALAVCARLSPASAASPCAGSR